jgi:nitrogen PTS system EIIA component
MPLGWFSRKKDAPQPSVPAAPAAPAAPSQASPVKGVAISRLLSEELIVSAAPGMDKDRFMDALARKLCAQKNLGDHAPFLSRVLEREQGISTTLDTGLAVPHARMDGLEGIAAVLGLVPQGMPDPKQADLTIRAMFMFFSPNRQDAFTQHLHLLRGVSALFQAGFIDEMLRDPAPASVLALIRSKEQSL